MNITNLKKALPYLFEARLVPMIHGHRGIGKSSAIRQFCEENGYTMVDVRLGQMSDAGDILGLPEFLRGTDGNAVATKFMRPSFLPTTPKHVIFLDEINRAHKDILQAIFQLVLDRRIHEYVLPEDCHIVAACNPETKEYIVQDFGDEAFKDRFVHIKLQPTVNDWIKYGKANSVSPNILDFIQDQTKYLEGDLEEFKIDVKPSRRSWEAASRLEVLNPPDTIFSEMLRGIVGLEATSAYNEFRKNDKRLLVGKKILQGYTDEIREIVKKYSSVEDNRMDVLRKVCDEILDEMKGSKKLTEKQKEQIVKFLLDLPEDLYFGTLKNWSNNSESNFLTDEYFSHNEKLVERSVGIRNAREK